LVVSSACELIYEIGRGSRDPRKDPRKDMKDTGFEFEISPKP
jgi:hypothetical protein